MNLFHFLAKKTASIFDKEEKDFSEKAFSPEGFSSDPFSSFLLYEAYDEKHQIFINKQSMGFTIETAPLVGGDEASEKIIQSLFQEMSEGSSLQCLLWADHRVEPFLNKWASARRGEIYQEAARRRIEHTPSNSRIFRFILSYSTPLPNDIERGVKQLAEVKEKFVKILKSITYAFIWKPKDLLETVGGLVNFTFSPQVIQRHWNPYQTLASQIGSGGKLFVEEDSLSWKNEAAFKSFRVFDFPETGSQMHSLIGDLYRDRFRIPFPFYLHYGVHLPSQEKVEQGFWRRSQLIENQGKSSYLIRLIPELANELRECDTIRRAVNQGSRFVWTQLSAGIWAKPDLMPQAEQSLKSLFRINQYQLAENSCIHLPQFLSTLPMSWTESIQDLKSLDVLKTTISSECSQFVPIQGEWMGTSTPGMLLVGRRGQLLNWNPFDNQSGNYNCVVVGRSGSGKSVFMQELLFTGMSIGAKAYVLDVGRSFDKLCDLLNGQKIDFSPNKPICLNPFTKIPLEEEERETAFTFLKSIVSCMAAPTEGTSDYENALIERAIYEVWKEKKNKATITDLALWLQIHQDEKAKKLGVMLTPYTKNGIYARYFEGENNINFSNRMVLIELEELKNKKDLQAVVLQLAMMTIANEAFLGDRKTPFYICIDEAWDLLRAKQTEEFIETLARRLRKYNGSLVIGTQSIEDFFSCPGAHAAYENSDWICLLAQKKSSIPHMAKSGKFAFTPSMQQALETVTAKHGEYSEIMICDADGNFSIARLILDPFSKLLYSTKAQEYAKIKELMRSGIGIVEAIERASLLFR